MKNFSKKLMLTLILSLLLAPGVCLAVDGVPVIKNPFDNLQIPIPGMPRFQEAGAIDVNGNYQSTWIAEYIVGIYKYAISIIGVIAMMAVAIGGVMWIVSAGNQSRVSEAKAWITSGLMGLALGLGSYILLSLINVDLVNFKPLNMGYLQEDMIEGINIVDGGSESEAQTNAAGRTCAKDEDLITLDASTTGCDFFTAEIRKITKQLAAELRKVCDIAHQKGIKVSIDSAYRTLDKQTRLYNAVVAKYGSSGGRVAYPSCNAPHMAGVAIDASPRASDKSKGVGEAQLWSLLQASFKEAGWGRYCRERWHFQPAYDKRGATC